MRRFAHLLTALLVWAAMLFVLPTSALAECDGSMISFRENATLARRVVIGRVTSVDATAPWRDENGASSRFTLRVHHAIRGPFENSMTLRDLAYLNCSDHILQVRKGDRIALALGIPERGGRINTAAWIDGTPFPFGERISVRETFALFDLTPPDTATVSPAPAADPRRIDASPLLLASVFIVSLRLALRRLEHRSSR